MALVQVSSQTPTLNYLNESQAAPLTHSTYQQLVDHYTREDTTPQPRLLHSLCARRLLSQSLSCCAIDFLVSMRIVLHHQHKLFL